jgi:HK97 gp10 family phage protein
VAGVTIKHNNLGTMAANLRPRAHLVVQKTAFDVEARAKEFAAVDTGAMRSSIHAEMTGELTAEVGVGVDYAVHVEYGTSRAAAQPFMTPAADAVRPDFEAAIRQVLNGG